MEWQSCVLHLNLSFYSAEYLMSPAHADLSVCIILWLSPVYCNCWYMWGSAMRDVTSVNLMLPHSDWGSTNRMKISTIATNPAQEPPHCGNNSFQSLPGQYHCLVEKETYPYRPFGSLRPSSIAVIQDQCRVPFGLEVMCGFISPEKKKKTNNIDFTSDDITNDRKFSL